MARFIVTRDVRSKIAVEADDAQKAQAAVIAGKGDVIEHNETFRAAEDKQVKYSPIPVAKPTEPPAVAPDVPTKTASRK